MRKRKTVLPHSERAFSFRRYAWLQFRRRKAALVSLYMVGFLVFVALFASFLANDQPLYAKYRGKTFYPALHSHWLFSRFIENPGIDSTLNPVSGTWEKIQFDITDWRQLPLESVVWAPVPYSPSRPDIYNRDFAAPGDVQYFRNAEGEVVEAKGHFKHWLGTDLLGRDVLAGLIHGAKIALLVGLVSMGISTLIGVLLGALAGYFGDYGLYTSRIRLWLLLPGIVLGYFYGFVARGYAVTEGFEQSFAAGIGEFIFGMLILIAVPFFFSQLGRLLEKGFLAKRMRIPVDSLVSRGIEIFNSLPRLLLIISVSAVIEERSLWMVMVIIGLTSWSEIARFTRAELLRVREMDYIAAARTMGYSNRRIIFRHALPNSLAPVFVSVAFGIASAILIESGLSFLQIGVPDETVTWGSMLNVGRIEPEAWWMIVFPGLAIFITITVYNLIGEGLRDALDPKLKS